jgi:OOP family OmpA-OmpF porin
VILPDQNITEAVQVVADQETYKKIVIPVAAPIQAETIVRYIEPIYFDSNKDTIKPESYKALDDVYSIILEFPNIENLQIEAHTDSQGKDAYNLDLSNRRAQAAKEYLVRKGVGKAQIKTMGFGEVRPIAPNETVEGRAKNRRVEFLIQAPNQNVKILQKAQ